MALHEGGEEGEIAARETEIPAQERVHAVRAQREGGDLVVELADGYGGVIAGLGAGVDEVGGGGGDPADADAGEGVGF